MHTKWFQHSVCSISWYLYNGGYLTGKVFLSKTFKLIIIIIINYLNRYLSIFKPISLMKKSKLNRQLFAICMCIFLSFVWSSMPLLGWSFYSMQPNAINCAAELCKRNRSVLSYNAVYFGCVFVVPQAIILYTNFKIFKIVSWYLF